MQEQYHKWHSPILNRNIEMLVFGHSGRPIILFPTSLGKYYEAKDRGLIDAVKWFVENGFAKIYCPDSIDALSWYNKDVDPLYRAYNHNLYDQCIEKEVLEQAFAETGWNTVTMAGCSFGGYHATNFAFKHPEKVHALLSMSGIFNIKDYIDGAYNDTVYYNNPIDFIPNNYNAALWSLKIILGTSKEDICLEQNKQLSNILHKKKISHWLDVRENAPHDWPTWLAMFPHYLSVL